MTAIVSPVGLTVLALSGTHYRVSGGKRPHDVDLTDTAAPSCDCEDFAYRGHTRPCKHIRAVVEFREADPQGPMLDALSEADTLDVIDPPGRGSAEPRTPDLDAVAIADAALATWRRELAAGQRTAVTFDALWVAASATVLAREAMHNRLSGSAAQSYAFARAVIEQEAAA